MASPAAGFHPGFSRVASKPCWKSPSATPSPLLFRKSRGWRVSPSNPPAANLDPSNCRDGSLEYVFEYLVSSYKTGTHILPAIEVMTSGAKNVTEPVEFTVFNPDELQWSDAVVGSTRFRYASAFRIMNSRPYEGEATPVEIKIYVPRDLFVDDWGIPDFQRDGVTSWRFQPSKLRGPINLLGLPYSSVAYPSTLTPTRSGKVGIGPATVRLVTRENVMDGFLRTVYREVHLAIPKLEVETTPLPASAPEGFENAVGDFKSVSKPNSPKPRKAIRSPWTSPSPAAEISTPSAHRSPRIQMVGNSMKPPRNNVATNAVNFPALWFSISSCVPSNSRAPFRHFVWSISIPGNKSTKH